ncbi:MAG: threonine synthase [Spirochaetia bacterium]
MRFTSRAHPSSTVSFREALFTGLAPDGGLYHPVESPDLAALFASFDDSTPFQELGCRTFARILSPELSEEEVRRIGEHAFSFAPTLRRLDETTALLELFNGPSCAFKDYGAQFMALAMEHLLGTSDERIQILVATSGDTGSAVAQAFFRRRNIDVVILYPSGRVSELQEKQLTTLGENVHALEVSGSFDDCQRLVKEAFQDPVLKARLRLTSANSINVGRLLPQSLYYVFAATRRQTLGGRAPVICVPSGNFGNLTAGVYAWHWGLSVESFIAATNSNDVIPHYLKTGRFVPRASEKTLSNAMDVGNPSNFERLEEVFRRDWRDMAARIRGVAISDDITLGMMGEIYRTHGVLVDPHTAVGIAAARSALESDMDRDTQIIVLSTAHPGKFADTVLRATGRVPEMPQRLAACLTLPCRSVRMGTTLTELSKYLLDCFG